MWIFPLVGYVGSILAFVFLTIAIATGLYYISELIEEHTVVTKRIISRLIFGVMGLQVLLMLFDGFPINLSLLTIGSHLVYYGNLKKFPFVNMTNPTFLASIVLVLTNHFLWFRYFSNFQEIYLKKHLATGSMYDQPTLPTFPQIASFFGIIIWLVPFCLFISLSANDHVLPTMTTSSHITTSPGASIDNNTNNGLGIPTGMGPAKRQGIFKAMIDGVRNRASEVMNMGASKRRATRDL
ncbi:Protein SVP26 [Ceratocystis fimbriata CBS 114723]|uniref:Protein SVP26 n=1 Tax=Ceratocystis fimbriata CBS 114723 TaxID=1035309 RepID=A0A2C5X514_9PEZI|nr:Protein SVP26 [Ceratocystis fimbriata CBS 114723]